MHTKVLPGPLCSKLFHLHGPILTLIYCRAVGGARSRSSLAGFSIGISFEGIELLKGFATDKWAETHIFISRHQTFIR